jgi:hypothetical protein
MGSIKSNGTCLPCDAGRHSDNSSAPCELCGLGEYSESPGSAYCDQCPKNTYADKRGQVHCTPCPHGYTTFTIYTAATSKKECVNVKNNIIEGYVALVVGFVLAFIYILRGRMNSVAFGRKRYIQEVGKTYAHLCDVVGRVQLDAPRVRLTEIERYLLLLIFSVGAVTTFAVVVLILCFLTLGQILFSSIIIWRSFGLRIDVSFIAHMKRAVESLEQVLWTVIPVKAIYEYTFAAMDFLWSIDIRLDEVQVTCQGAQAPITMLLDVALFIAVVMAIECDIAAFLATSFARAHAEYRSLVLNSKARNTVDHPVGTKIWWWLLSNAETALVNPSLVMGLLQYAVSLISIGEFFSFYGMHPFNFECTYSGHEIYLAIAGTATMYCLILPVAYNVPKLLVPRLLKKDKIVSSGMCCSASHSSLTKMIRDQQVTLWFSCIPNIDSFVSWRFVWAYKILHTRSYGKDELMFLTKDDPPVPPPSGIGLCPLVSTVNEEFQKEWIDECEERLPHYGVWCGGAFYHYFYVVLQNYWTFLQVMFGIWDADAVRKFNIINTMVYNGCDIAQYLEQPEYESSSKTPLFRSLSKLAWRFGTCLCGGSAKVGDGFVPDDGGESRLLVSALVAAELSTRSTLFLLLPFGGLITTFVSSTSANPIFCRRAKKLSKLLPALLIFDAYTLAERRVLLMGTYAPWKVRLMAVYIFVTESRLVNYLYSLMKYLMTLSITFFPVMEFLAFGVCVILLYSVVSSIHPVITLANVLEVGEEENLPPPRVSDLQQRPGDPPAPLTRGRGMRRQITERASSLHFRGSTYSAEEDEPRVSNYNFYSGHDEDTDEEDTNADSRNSLQTNAHEIDYDHIYKAVGEDALEGMQMVRLASTASPTPAVRPVQQEAPTGGTSPALSLMNVEVDAVAACVTDLAADNV